MDTWIVDDFFENVQGRHYLSSFWFRRWEAVRELESTGGKSTGICTGCTAAGRHRMETRDLIHKNANKFCACRIHRVRRESLSTTPRPTIFVEYVGRTNLFA